MIQTKGMLQKHTSERQAEFPMAWGNGLTLQIPRWFLLSVVAALLTALDSPGQLFICWVCRMETDPGPQSNFITTSAKPGRFSS